MRVLRTKFESSILCYWERDGVVHRKFEGAKNVVAMDYQDYDLAALQEAFDKAEREYTITEQENEP